MRIKIVFVLLKLKLELNSHRGVHRQCVQLVLLMRLGLTIKVPGHFGGRTALDSGRDPDWIASTDVQQVINQHVDEDRRPDCEESNNKANVSVRNIWLNE